MPNVHYQLAANMFTLLLSVFLLLLWGGTLFCGGWLLCWVFNKEVWEKIKGRDPPVSTFVRTWAPLTVTVSAFTAFPKLAHQTLLQEKPFVFLLPRISRGPTFCSSSQFGSAGVRPRPCAHLRSLDAPD